jgi:hypothetical protein
MQMCSDNPEKGTLIQLTDYRVHWRIVVLAALNLRVPLPNRRNILIKTKKN